MTDETTDVTIHTGGFHWDQGHVRMRTLLGSCVAITMWHPVKRMGGMCHYLLGGSRSPRDERVDLPGLFAEGAIALFIDAITTSGTNPKDYVTKMFGGGSMFPEQSRGSPCDDICDAAGRVSCRDVPCKNVIEGRDLLEKHGFTISAEHVGGVGSRQLIFDVWTGDVWVRQTAPLRINKDNAA